MLSNGPEGLYPSTVLVSLVALRGRVVLFQRGSGLVPGGLFT